MSTAVSPVIRTGQQPLPTDLWPSPSWVSFDTVIDNNGLLSDALFRYLWDGIQDSLRATLQFDSVIEDLQRFCHTSIEQISFNRNDLDSLGIFLSKWIRKELSSRELSLWLIFETKAIGYRHRIRNYISEVLLESPSDSVPLSLSSARNLFSNIVSALDLEIDQLRNELRARLHLLEQSTMNAFVEILAIRIDDDTGIIVSSEWGLLNDFIMMESPESDRIPSRDPSIHSTDDDPIDDLIRSDHDTINKICLSVSNDTESSIPSSTCSRSDSIPDASHALSRPSLPISQEPISAAAHSPSHRISICSSPDDSNPTPIRIPSPILLPNTDPISSTDPVLDHTINSDPLHHHPISCRLTRADIISFGAESNDAILSDTEPIVICASTAFALIGDSSTDGRGGTTPSLESPTDQVVSDPDPKSIVSTSATIAKESERDCSADRAADEDSPPPARASTERKRSSKKRRQRERALSRSSQSQSGSMTATSPDAYTAEDVSPPDSNASTSSASRESAPSDDIISNPSQETSAWPPHWTHRSAYISSCLPALQPIPRMGDVALHDPDAAFAFQQRLLAARLRNDLLDFFLQLVTLRIGANSSPTSHHDVIVSGLRSIDLLIGGFLSDDLNMFLYIADHLETGCVSDPDGALVQGLYERYVGQNVRRLHLIVDVIEAHLADCLDGLQILIAHLSRTSTPSPIDADAIRAAIKMRQSAWAVLHQEHVQRIEERRLALVERLATKADTDTTELLTEASFVFAFDESDADLAAAIDGLSAYTEQALWTTMSKAQAPLQTRQFRRLSVMTAAKLLPVYQSLMAKATNNVEEITQSCSPRLFNSMEAAYLQLERSDPLASYRLRFLSMLGTASVQGSLMVVLDRWRDTLADVAEAFAPLCAKAPLPDSILLGPFVWWHCNQRFILNDCFRMVEIPDPSYRPSTGPSPGGDVLPP